MPLTPLSTRLMARRSLVSGVQRQPVMLDAAAWAALEDTPVSLGDSLVFHPREQYAA